MLDISTRNHFSIRFIGSDHRYEIAIVKINLHNCALSSLTYYYRYERKRKPVLSDPLVKMDISHVCERALIEPTKTKEYTN
jgi:hypothetical protein